MGFLLSLNLTDEDRTEMARKIDDHNPANWLTLEQLDEKLKALDEAGRECRRPTEHWVASALDCGRLALS